MTFDVAVIGGGVVGCAIVRRMALCGLKSILLEKGHDILSGASKGNSAILHTGFDAPPGSIELACMQAGYEEYLAIREPLNLPLLECGAFVVAWTEEELAGLPAIVTKAHANNVRDVVQIDASELYKREPNLASRALGAVWVPREHLIDPWSAPLAYALQAIAHGAEVRRDCEVIGGKFEGDSWQLNTSRGGVRARIVINAAGLYGDLIEAIHKRPGFTIKPRKGQFVVYDKTAAALLTSIVLPVPTEKTKGVLVCRTIFGNVLVGPTAEEQDSREDASVDQRVLTQLIEQGEKILPALRTQPVNAIYAGLRPATERKEYQVAIDGEQRWITVAGIRSTGLTAALGIASYVAKLYSGSVSELSVTKSPRWTPVPNLAEHRPRPYQQSGRSEIICHCEQVTRAEIEAALQEPLPACSVGALKRRTRCMMGRCQGFYCSARVAELADDRLRDLNTTRITS
ncbi:MAG: NAD(P)/FAD-dependent oxidoreductase [Gammaproteobacteria bacterium]